MWEDEVSFVPLRIMILSCFIIVPSPSKSLIAGGKVMLQEYGMLLNTSVDANVFRGGILVPRLSLISHISVMLL